MTIGFVVNWQQESLYLFREKINLLKESKKKYKWNFKINL